MAIAVEHKQPKGYGRIRIEAIPNAQASTLGAFILANVEPGSVIISDGLKSYPATVGNEFTHKPLNVASSGHAAHIPLPGVHRVASLLKRWLLGTHQGAIDANHIQTYLNEFCFRFNRRNSRSRGMLFYRLMQHSAAMSPVTYRQLVSNPRPDSRPNTKPSDSKRNPSSLSLPPVGRPWRHLPGQTPSDATTST